MIKLTNLLTEGLGPSSSTIKKIEDFLKKELKVSNVKVKKYSQGRARQGYTFYPEGTKNGLYIDQAYDNIWNIYTVNANGFPLSNHWEIKKYEDDIEDEDTALKAAFDVIKKFGKKDLVESVNEEFTAISSKSGKTVVFKDKDARDAAVKAGTHEVPEDEKGGKDEPKGDKPNMFSKDTGYDAGDDGLGYGDETDRDSSLPTDASELNSNHMGEFGDAMDAESGLSGTLNIDDNSGAILYSVGNGEGDEPTYSIFIGSNEDYGKPEEFRVSLEPTYGNDPAGLSGKVDKTFKTAEEAKKFAAQVAKKYSKEMQMDDSETVRNEGTIKLINLLRK